MKHVKISFAVMTVLCSFIFILFGIGGVISSAAETEPTEQWDISKNAGVDNVVAKLYKINRYEELYCVVIDGDGEMKDFSPLSPPPWLELYADAIVSASVGAGVTYVGGYAFFDCRAFDSLTVYNPSARFYIVEDTILPSYSTICGHENSVAKDYTEFLYRKRFVRICEFTDSECNVCGFKCTSHSGGEANCEEAAKCKVCGIGYGSPLGHKYSDWVEGILPGCESDGMFSHYECLRCQKCFDEEYNEWQWIYISPIGHNYGQLISGTDADCANAGSIDHYKCARCEAYFDSSKNKIELIFTEALDHTGGVATCLEPCICDRCGEKYGNKNTENHDFSLFPTHDSENHWYECPCGERKDIVSHSYESEIVKEPSKSEEGIKRLFCDCGYEKTEYVDMLQSSAQGDDSSKPEKLAIPVIIAVVIASVVAVLAFAAVIIVKKRH